MASRVSIEVDGGGGVAVSEVSVERWGYVTPDGRELPAMLFRRGDGCAAAWRIGESASWRATPEACVEDVALLRGDAVAEVLRPGARAVTVRLTRETARAWRRLLAQWAAIGTLGEPGEELARELAAALGEGLGDGERTGEG